MATEYKIYLVNKGATKREFWCFLAQPEQLSGPEVFANSSASLAVRPNDKNKNTFTIPLQYSVGAGASNKAVGLNVRVDSSHEQNAQLEQLWTAEYKNAPPKEGPELRLSGKSSPNTISIKSNHYNQVGNENLGWYSNMSFGIQSDSGYIGMSWAPDADVTRIITPKFQFYVATGSYGSNKLADYNEVSNSSAVVALSDFLKLEATVTLEVDGTWTVTPGAPAPALNSEFVEQLITSHRLVCEAHSNLIKSMLQITSDNLYLLPTAHLHRDRQEDKVIAVKWDENNVAAENEITVLTGTITVSTALIASFAYFVLSGVTFNVTYSRGGETNLRFSYSGNQSAQAIKDLLRVGARILLVNRPDETSNITAIAG